MYNAATTAHKHADVIKAWADGAEIEQRFPKSKEPSQQKWHPLPIYPVFYEEGEYRVKPDEAELLDNRVEKAVTRAYKNHPQRALLVDFYYWLLNNGFVVRNIENP